MERIDNSGWWQLELSDIEFEGGGYVFKTKTAP